MQPPAGESPLTAITRLREGMAGLTEQLALAGQVAARPATGEDPTGTVRLTLDPAGRPFEVEVGSAWRVSIGPEGLTDAVRLAWQDAVGRRLAAWTEAFTEPGPPEAFRRPPVPAPAPPPSGKPASASSASVAPATASSASVAPATASSASVNPAPPASGNPASAPPGSVLPPGSAPGDLLGHRVQSNLSGLLSLLADAEAALDRIDRAGDAAPPVEGRDPDGQVTVLVSTDNLIELRADRRWLTEASGRVLGAAIRQALADAYAELDRRAAAQRPPVLDELTALTADPLTLLRTVGLLRD